MKNESLLPRILLSLCAGFLLLLHPLPADTTNTANPVMENHPVALAKKFALHTKANPSLPTLYLVGDSTMKNGTKGQEGWGDELAAYFDPTKMNVVNDAFGGTSSRTFQTQGRWDAVLAMVQKGDYVIVQFGHNDAGPVNDNFRARGSINGVGEDTQEIDNILTKKHEVVHTFGWYMRKYVTDIQAKGATPIVLSLVPWNSWKDGKIVRSTGDTYGDTYGVWSQQAAVATGAVFVDDYAIISDALDALGEAKALPLFKDKRLHSSHDGAVLNARCAVSGLKGMPGNPFGPYFSPAADAVPAFTTAAAAPETAPQK